MKLVQAKITNILGIEEQTISPDGRIIEVKGHNGAGKTSVLEAVKDALGCSKYATLLRDGAEKGEVVLMLEGLEIRRTHNGDKAQTVVKAQIPGTDAFSKISSPATFIKDRVNPNSVDPVRLLSAKPAELVNVVLQSMPLEVNPERIEQITGRPAGDLSGHALNVIGDISKEYFEYRTGINRDGKTLVAHKEQLAGTIPASAISVDEVRQKIEQAKQNIHSANEERQAKVSVIENEYNQGVATYSQKVTDINEQIAALEKARDEIQGKQRELRGDADARIQMVDMGIKGRISEAEQEITSLTRELGQSAVVENTRKQVDDLEVQIQSKRDESAKLTRVIAQLEVYKQELCSNLPIKGLELREGNLFLNNVSFETLNTAARVTLIVELAKLTAGDFGIVVLDNTEMLDSKTYAEFLRQAQETDLTFVVARVADTNLTIN